MGGASANPQGNKKISTEDEIVLKYLQVNGYQDIAAAFDSELKKEGNDPAAATNSSSTGVRNNGAVSASLQAFAKSIGLDTHACSANHLLFHGVGGSNASQHTDGYVRVMEWICNSLDMYKDELYLITYPLFVHIYLDLIAKNMCSQAIAFFQKHVGEHQRLHSIELKQLALVLNASHLQSNMVAKKMLNHKFQIQMSLLSFELLNAFLTDSQLFSLLYIINQRVTITVASNHPAIKIQQLQEDNYKKFVATDDDYYRKDAAATTPNEFAERLETSDQNKEVELKDVVENEAEMARMVNAVGKTGMTVDDLHESRILWGVIPTAPVTDSANASMSDALPGTTDDKMDVESSSAEVADGSPNAPTTDGANSLSELNPSAAPFEVTGPPPDRKSSYNSNILEKLVLRQSVEAQQKAIDDLKSKLEVSQSSLPSALCFTFVNAHRGITNIDFTDDVTTVAACFEDSSIRVWRNDNLPIGTAVGHRASASSPDIPEEQRYAVLRGHSAPVYASSFSPDNQHLLSSSADKTVRLWNLASRSNVVRYPCHDYPVWDVAFSPFGYYFATGCLDRTARLFSTDRMHPLRLFVGHLSDVECVQFHPNCNYIATGSSDQTSRLWDVQTGNCVRIFSSHYGAVRTMAFSPNGRLLATAGDDLFINIWDIGTGKKLDTLRGHESFVHSLSFSQEGKVLASGGEDQTVRLWDMAAVGVESNTKESEEAPIAPQRVQVRQERPRTRVSPSTSLIRTLKTKHTPVYKVKFTKKNLLLTGGCYSPPSNISE